MRMSALTIRMPYSARKLLCGLSSTDCAKYCRANSYFPCTYNNSAYRQWYSGCSGCSNSNSS